TIAAFAFRHSRGLPYVLPRNDLDYIGNYVNMTFEIGGRHEPNPVLQRALEILLILHADHEQNCSTSAVRGVGSSQVDSFSAGAAGIAALYGPLHGGANEAVLRLLDEIGGAKNVPAFIEQVKAGHGRRLSFGHGVYKSDAPRSKLIKRVADDVFAQTGLNPKLEIALELERIALEDEYFVSRRLYPNVDFYSGLIYQAMGYPTDYFSVLFALGRLPGWISQWEEHLSDPEQKISRPRQIYTGENERPYVAVAQRGGAPAAWPSFVSSPHRTISGRADGAPSAAPDAAVRDSLRRSGHEHEPDRRGTIDRQDLRHRSRSRRGAAWHRPHARARRDGGDHGTERMRQDDAAQLPLRAGRGGRGRGRHRGDVARRDVRPPAHRLPRAAHGVR